MQQFRSVLNFLFFFFLGAIIMALLISSLSYLAFTLNFRDKIYPGVTIDGVNFGNQTKTDITKFFQDKNLSKITLELIHKDASLSATGKDIDLRYDTNLMASRAFSIGRQTKNPYHNLLQILSAWQGNINLPLEVGFDQRLLNAKIDTIAPKIEKLPIDAVFEFSPNIGPDNRGRVQAFQPSSDGLTIDRAKVIEQITSYAKNLPIDSDTKDLTWVVPLPTKIEPPKITSTTANDLGIKTLIGKGESYFYDSIPGRIYNIGLGASKINGRLIAPSEVFSFDNAIGTVSAIFGFQKAYSIIKGKTVLDDGGGVCQVSTTLYRAVLNAGLPVVERVAHTYRVGFYEQGGFLPGLDATVYPPSPDFRFKNDTGNWILIQVNFDQTKQKLTFDLFGTSDGRQTTITGPVFINTSPPPEPIYEDDPTKPVGSTTQVDTAHAGAKVYFTRKVVRGNEILVNETIYSDYIPWPARLLRGTKT